MIGSLSLDSSKYHILVVDDEELMRNLVVKALSELGHSWVTAVNGLDALNQLAENQFDAVITDIIMPHMDGMMLTREISKQYPSIPVMVMIHFDEEYLIGTALSMGAHEFIKKPFSFEEFSIRLYKMISDSQTPNQLKNQTEAEETVRDLMEELEVTLKKGSPL